jgi:hypothetical protein
MLLHDPPFMYQYAININEYLSPCGNPPSLSLSHSITHSLTHHKVNFPYKIKVRTDQDNTKSNYEDWLLNSLFKMYHVYDYKTYQNNYTEKFKYNILLLLPLLLLLLNYSVSVW